MFCYTKEFEQLNIEPGTTGSLAFQVLLRFPFKMFKIPERASFNLQVQFLHGLVVTWRSQGGKNGVPGAGSLIGLPLATVRSSSSSWLLAQHERWSCVDPKWSPNSSNISITLGGITNHVPFWTPGVQMQLGGLTNATPYLQGSNTTPTGRS